MSMNFQSKSKFSLTLGFLAANPCMHTARRASITIVLLAILVIAAKIHINRDNMRLT